MHGTKKKRGGLGGEENKGSKIRGGEIRRGWRGGEDEEKEGEVERRR